MKDAYLRSLTNDELLAIVHERLGTSAALIGGLDEIPERPRFVMIRPLLDAKQVMYAIADRLRDPGLAPDAAQRESALPTEGRTE